MTTHLTGTRDEWLAARRASQQRLRPREIAELGHGDAAKRERRRIVAQRDALQRAERIAGRERPGRSRDQRVHANPVTLVTPTRPRRPVNLSQTTAAGCGPLIERSERHHDDAHNRNT